MAVHTLYTYPDNFRAYKALIAVEYSGQKLKVVSEAPDFVLGQTNKSAEFLSKFPLGKVPALTTAIGKHIFESNAIAYFLANEQLRGKNVIDEASVQQWISFADNQILPPACSWVFPIMGIMPYDKNAADKAMNDMRKALGALNDYLLTRTYLVGERITLADITCMANLLLPFKYVLDPEFRAEFNNVTRWFVTMVNQEEVKKVIGEFTICQKRAQFDPKKTELLSINGLNKEVKSEKPKKGCNQVDKEPKGKDPFASHPKSAFNLEEFKRIYSNEDIGNRAIPYFWKNFDKDNYSIWLMEYKYPEDLGIMFQSENLITGMFQHLDKLNKNAFAIVGLFGKSRNAQIQGIWVWRGQGLVFNLNKNWQADHDGFNWIKLDPSAAYTKNIVDKFFVHKEDIQEYQPSQPDTHRKFIGHKLYSACIFK